MPLGAFQPPKPGPGGSATVFPGRCKVSLQPMAATACSTLNARKTIAQPSLGETTQRLRREKKLNLIRTIIPEFKDLAQSWGWKMITVREKMYP
jgi:hypothetical protein